MSTTIRNALTFLLVFLISGITRADLVGTVTYYHTNLVGSPVAATSSTGAVLWTSDYLPYGEKYAAGSNSGTNKVWFAGHVQDAPANLVYMEARYYDPDSGRFMAIDPAGFTEKNPQSFNRYAYANNNPYKYNDPDGKSPLLAVIVVGTAVLLATNTAQAPTSSTDIHPNMDTKTAEVATAAGGLIGLGRSLLMRGAGEAAAEGGATVNSAGREFFADSTLHPRVLEQLGKNDNHAFPTLVDKVAEEYGTVSKVLDSRGNPVDMLTLKGVRNGVEGTYEYIKNSSGQIYHRFFNPAE